MIACFDKQDRTSSIYGHISDENGKSVDSIQFIVDGAQFTRFKILKSVYSDRNGNYELVVEVPKDFSSLVVNVPFLPDKNPKFQNFYKGFLAMYKNDVRTNNCCFANVGEKTKYDF